MQKLAHCSEFNSEFKFLSDIDGFQSFLSDQTIYRIRQFLWLWHYSVPCEHTIALSIVPYPSALKTKQSLCKSSYI